MTTKIIDGSNIKTLVEDKNAFAKYVDEKFKLLDKSHTGKLSKEELQPVVLAIGSALGLPPKSTSPESDHIYDEVLGEFIHGKNQSITKQEFTPVLRDMLLGVADGLERDPVVLVTVNGAQLQSYAESSNFEVDAVGVFSELDTSGEGKLKGTAIKIALTKIKVEQGMPPAADPKVMKKVVEPALQKVGVDLQKDMKQDQFLSVYRQVLFAIASDIKQKPVTVAHTEKCFDGQSISSFLQNKPILDECLNETWSAVPKNSNETLPKANLRLGLDLLAPFAGLPPLGAVDEVDHVVDESFKLVNVDEGGDLNKEEFKKCLLEVLGGIMLQLKGKAVAITSNVLTSDSNPEDFMPL